MNKITISVILCIVAYVFFEQKIVVENCIIFYEEPNTSFEEKNYFTNVFNITYKGIFSKEVIKVNEIAVVVSYNLDVDFIEEKKEEYQSRASEFESIFSSYTYEIESEDNEWYNYLKVEFNSQLLLEEETKESLLNSEYKDILTNKGSIDFSQLKQSYQEQGAFCQKNE